MKTKPEKMEDALVDVRRAYRLLHDYQRAALDTVKYVGYQLGFEYWDGEANFSLSAPRGSNAALFDRWAWDWLNLVFYDFTFRRKAGDEYVYFAVWLFSDTGYFLSDDGGTKTEVARFAPPEKSSTTVAFFFFRQWPDTPFLEDRAAVRRFLETKGTLPKVFSDKGVFAQCHDYSRLAGAEAADALIDELETFAKANKFPVQRTKKA